MNQTLPHARRFITLSKDLRNWSLRINCSHSHHANSYACSGAHTNCTMRIFSVDILYDNLVRLFVTAQVPCEHLLVIHAQSIVIFLIESDSLKDSLIRFSLHPRAVRLQLMQQWHSKVAGADDDGAGRSGESVAGANCMTSFHPNTYHTQVSQLR